MSETCMGGFCPRRARCHWYAPGEGDPEPIERLCEPGQFNAFIPTFTPEPEVDHADAPR